MVERANGRMTVPQIFIGATHVGGSDDLYELERAGKLDPLLAGQASRRTSAHDTGHLHRRPGPDALGPGTGGQSRDRDQADRARPRRPAPTTCRRPK